MQTATIKPYKTLRIRLRIYSMERDKTIYFNKQTGRLSADALDVYNWLLRRNVNIAKEFRIQSQILEKKILEALLPPKQQIFNFPDVILR